MRSRRNEKAAARRKLLTQGRIIFEEKNDHDQVLVGGFSVQNAQNTGLRVMFGIFFDHHFILSLLSLLNHGGFVKHVGGFMAQTCLGCGGSNSTSGPPGPSILRLLPQKLVVVQHLRAVMASQNSWNMLEIMK